MNPTTARVKSRDRRTDIPPSPRRIPTGIGGLDEVMDGGLPRAGITVVIGDAGTGKTTFGLQVLATGLSDGNESGLIVAFEESAEQLLANTSGFTWGGQALSGHRIRVIDAQLSKTIERRDEFDLVGLLSIVAVNAQQVGAKRIVFDGLDVLLAYLDDPVVIRREMFRLRDWIHASGLSAIVTAKADVAQAAPSVDYDFLQFMADCVITLHHRVTQGTASRQLRVVKYRGAGHSANELPLTITREGLEVAANTMSERSYAVSSERVSSGIARLDAMLSGGYHRGSSVLITGAPGTAKTSIVAAFAEAAALRDECTLFVTFDEAAHQIVRNVASIGIQLGPHVEAGTIRIHSRRAQSESPEGHVAQIRALLKETRTHNLVVDSLSSIAQRGCESEAEAAAVQLLDLAKGAGITVLSTSLHENTTPLVDHSPLRISTIADTWMHVSYETRAGERKRALTVIKARGTAHSNQVRELVLSKGGVTLTDVFSADGEVPMNTLRWEKATEPRRLRLLGQDNVVLHKRKLALGFSATKTRLEALAMKQALRETALAKLRADLTTRIEQGDPDTLPTSPDGLAIWHA
jgi:circadian clock protein KaiC